LQVFVGPIGENIAFITKLSSSLASGSSFYTDDGPEIFERVSAHFSMVMVQSQLLFAVAVCLWRV
jgi:hypothetical protein